MPPLEGRLLEADKLGQTLFERIFLLMYKFKKKRTLFHNEFHKNVIDAP